MSTSKHFTKIAGLAVMAVLTISAFAAAAASAATWTVEGSKLEEGTAKGVAVNGALKAGTVASLTGTVLAQHILITATSMTTTNGTIFQEGTSAKDEGVLEFSGLTIDTPAGCGISSPIITKQLTSELVDHMGSKTAYDKFFPEEGSVLATIKITGCPIAGSYNLKGVIYGEGNEWGTIASPQPLKFSDAINTTLGGTITLGTCDAEFTAETSFTLASGLKFGADT